MAKIRRTKRPPRIAARESGSDGAARGAAAESLWREIFQLAPGNRLALRFFATFGILALAYFAATLDLKLKDPESSGVHPVAAGLTGANQWVRQTWLEPYQRGIAALSAALLGAIGDEAKAQGREIRSPAFAVTVTNGCDAIEPSLLLAVAMLSFPALWREKVVGLLLGMLAIAALNIVRVVTLWLVGLHWRVAFDVIHFTIWPFLIIVLTIFVFVHWLRYVARARGASAAVAA